MQMRCLGLVVTITVWLCSLLFWTSGRWWLHQSGADCYDITRGQVTGTMDFFLFFRVLTNDRTSWTLMVFSCRAWTLWPPLGWVGSAVENTYLRFPPRLDSLPELSRDGSTAGRSCSPQTSPEWKMKQVRRRPEPRRLTASQLQMLEKKEMTVCACARSSCSSAPLSSEHEWPECLLKSHSILGNIPPFLTALTG